MTLDNEDRKVKRDTREDIIDIAIDLFSERGYSGVSIRDITKRAGIRESSLYNHFKSKDELLDVIIERFRVEFGKECFHEEKIEEQLETMEPELFFQHHIISLREKITPTRQKIWKIVYMEQFRDKRARDFVLKEIIGRPQAFYTKAFSVMAEKGLIKPIDPKLLADEYNYGLMAMSIERMLLQTDDEDVMPIVKKMFAHIKFICEIIKK